MPSPFPGMDPYLEEPSLWLDVHARLVGISGEFLGRSLRPNYLVRIEQRVYISDENDPGRLVMIPDLRIAIPPAREGPAFLPGGDAVVDVAEPIEAITLIEEEIRDSYIEIVDRVDRSVVTVIEILSPTNKMSGSKGRESYEWKREAILRSPTHLVGIDLLRRGLPIPVYGGIPEHEYLVHVSRASRRPGATLWPIRISQRLPAIRIPLKTDDENIALDLQEVLTAAYDRAGYDLEIDYLREPVPALEGEWKAWAHRLLRDSGLRPE